MILSLLDLDLYKLTMQQFAWWYGQQYGVDPIVRYKFKCRRDEDLSPIFKRVKEEILKLKKLELSKTERQYLFMLGYFKDGYLDQLERLRLDPEKDVQISMKDGELDIQIKGFWFDTILYETYILSIISECWVDHKLKGNFDITALSGLMQKRSLLASYDKPINITDFGTRRRKSAKFQRRMLMELQPYLAGTSNVHFARTLGMKPVGTMAHEYLQAFQALAKSLKHFQREAFDEWAKLYPKEMRIALTDIIGVDSFMKDFPPRMQDIYEGFRHDSGDPDEWFEKIGLMYHLRPQKDEFKDKVMAFSDGLDLREAFRLNNKFGDLAKLSFGIGTHLTNDGYVNPLPIVIKMVECNKLPVAKISDSPGKGMCEDEEYLENLRNTFACL